MNGDSNFPTAFFFFLFSENRGARVITKHVAASRHPVSTTANSVNRGVYHDLDPSLSLSLSLFPRSMLFHPSRSPISGATFSAERMADRLKNVARRLIGREKLRRGSVLIPIDPPLVDGRAKRLVKFSIKASFTQPMRILELVFPHLRTPEDSREGYDIIRV